jgi:hypothetical protein
MCLAGQELSRTQGEPELDPVGGLGKIAPGQLLDLPHPVAERVPMTVELARGALPLAVVGDEELERVDAGTGVAAGTSAVQAPGAAGAELAPEIGPRPRRRDPVPGRSGRADGRRCRGRGRPHQSPQRAPPPGRRSPALRAPVPPAAPGPRSPRAGRRAPPRSHRPARRPVQHRPTRGRAPGRRCRRSTWARSPVSRACVRRPGTGSVPLPRCGSLDGCHKMRPPDWPPVNATEPAGAAYLA